MVDAAQNRKWVWVIGPPSLLVTSIQTAKRHENFRTLIYEEWKKPGIQAQVDNSGRSGSGGMKVGAKQMCNLMVSFSHYVITILHLMLRRAHKPCGEGVNRINGT